MITPSTEKRIITECCNLCETFRLDQAYLAQKVGPRLHYIAGYGAPSLDKPEQLPLSHNLVLLWHGVLPPEAKDICQRQFDALMKRIEEELPVKTPHQQNNRDDWKERNAAHGP